jgi:hypothetical protein
MALPNVKGEKVGTACLDKCNEKLISRYLKR